MEKDAAPSVRERLLVLFDKSSLKSTFHKFECSPPRLISGVPYAFMRPPFSNFQDREHISVISRWLQMLINVISYREIILPDA